MIEFTLSNNPWLQLRLVLKIEDLKKVSKVRVINLN